MATKYTANDIQVLDSLQHIILRKGMYIGDSDDPRQLLSEIFDNAMDEIQAGFSKELVVTIDTKKNSYEVRDFGRGIPHGLKKLPNGEQKEVLEVLLTESNSGGKFDNSNYSCSSGLNGLGMTLTNALSTTMEVISYRGGKYVKAVGDKVGKVTIERGEVKKRDGTKVTFIPNPKHFNTPKIPTDFILNRCRIASALGFRARLIIDKEEINTNYSIFDLMKEEKVSTYAQVSPIEVVSSTGEKMKVALKYTSETNTKYFGFTNLLSNTSGGTHVQELARIVSAAWKEFIDKNKNLRPSVELESDDYLVGLRGVCAVFISKPEFSSQTKEKLVVNKKYFEELMGLFKKQFTKYLKQNIDIANQLIKRFEEYRIAKNNLQSKKELSSLIKVNNEDDENVRRRSIVSKLVECTSKKKADTEMFIVEGNSALGPFKFARDVKTQAILPLRGKILNVTGKSIKEAVQNKEICDIANSLGCGIGSACDAKKARYERVIIAADADVDGMQISSLVLSVFVNLFPDMIKQGKVFIAVPPLYVWGSSPKDFNGCNKIEDIPTTVKHFHRNKGLGAMSNAEVKHFLVSKDTRMLVQVYYPQNLELFNKILGTSEGKSELMRELGVIIDN